MDELLEELEYEIKILTQSGFYNTEEINEIIEEQFLDENLDKYNMLELIEKSVQENNKQLTEENLSFFKNLKESFNQLTSKQIVCIHNAGFEFEEGVNDAIEIYTHLFNNKFNPKGFVFYTFTDIEYAIEEEELFLSFGDYEKNQELALEIGKEIKKTLIDNNLTVVWNENIDEQILIKPFRWIKEYDEELYEMEGSVESYMKINKLE